MSTSIPAIMSSFSPSLFFIMSISRGWSATRNNRELTSSRSKECDSGNLNEGLNTANDTNQQDSLEISPKSTIPSQHNNGSSTCILFSRVRQKLGELWDEVDDVLSGAPITRCYLAPDTCSDDEPDGETVRECSDDNEIISSNGDNIILDHDVILTPTREKDPSQVTECDDTVKIKLHALMSFCQSTETVSPANVSPANEGRYITRSGNSSLSSDDKEDESYEISKLRNDAERAGISREYRNDTERADISREYRNDAERADISREYRNDTERADISREYQDDADISREYFPPHHTPHTSLSSPIDELHRLTPSDETFCLASSKIPILSSEAPDRINCNKDAVSPIRFIRILSKSPKPGTVLSPFSNNTTASYSSERPSKRGDETPDPFNEQSPDMNDWMRSNSYYNEIFTEEEIRRIPTPELFDKLRENVPVKPPRPIVEDKDRESWAKFSALNHNYSAPNIECSVSKTGYNANTVTESGYVSQYGDESLRYVKEIEIGVGGFGKVYIAKDTVFKEEVVLKEMELNKVRMEDIAEEVAILDRYPHENIMKLLDHYSTVTHYCMVFEFQSQLSLFEYLRMLGRQTEEEAKVILRQVVNALDWLHENMIIHGDVKDENMIIQSHTRNIILIDFGSARILEEPLEPVVFRGTRVYSPPETVMGDVAFGQSLDVWTIGTFVYVMLSNKRPFVDDQEILNACLPYPRLWTDGAKDFVRQCLNKEYMDRPTVKTLKYHPWLMSYST